MLSRLLASGVALRVASLSLCGWLSYFFVGQWVSLYRKTWDHSLWLSMWAVSGYIRVCLFCVLCMTVFAMFNILMVFSHSLLLSSMLKCCLVPCLCDCSNELCVSAQQLSPPSNRLMYSVWFYGTCFFFKFLILGLVKWVFAGFTLVFSVWCAHLPWYHSCQLCTLSPPGRVQGPWVLRRRPAAIFLLDFLVPCDRWPTCILSQSPGNWVGTRQSWKVFV